MSSDSSSLPRGAAPHIRTKKDTGFLGLLYTLSLLPLFAASVYRHGLMGFLLPCISMLIFAGVEMAASFFVFKRRGTFDFFCVAAGLASALILPAQIPVPFFLLLILGLAVIGRQLLERQLMVFVCLPLVGRLAAGFLYEDLFVFGVGEPLAGRLAGVGFSTMGGDCVLALSLSYLFLLLNSWLRRKLTPIFLLLSMVCFAVFRFFFAGDTALGEFLFTGGALFVAVFALADPRTTPYTFAGQMAYAGCGAAGSVVLWQLGFSVNAGVISILALQVVFCLLRLPFFQILFRDIFYWKKRKGRSV